MIETGLGGRLDATNVLCPVLTIITDISLDHAEILGPTLRDIAGEKAGIIKSGVPTLIGYLPRAARSVIAARCRQLKAPLVPLANNGVAIDARDGSVRSHIPGLRLNRLVPSLPGLHQLKNAALAIKATECLRRAGFRINRAQMKDGLTDTEWAGRFQVLPDRSGRPTVVLDVCHNPGGTRAFVETFRKTFPRRKAKTIVGFVRRKPHQELIELLASITEQFWLVPLASKRSVDTIELMQTIDWQGVPVKRAAKLDTAWRRVCRTATADDVVAVIGSHYLVGEFLRRHGDR